MGPSNPQPVTVSAASHSNTPPNERAVHYLLSYSRKTFVAVLLHAGGQTV